MRLQKYLAEIGVASRRKSEEYIVQGLIKVNGEIITKLGTVIDPEKDKIEIDPSLTAASAKKRYIMLNKPVGIVTTCASHVKESTVVDLVKVSERVFPIGRLDKDTSGLLILTNDGTITHRLLHPSFEKEKEYEVTVSGPITLERKAKLEAGVRLFGEKTKQTNVKILDSHRMRITLSEGKNRQVRRICRKVGIPVVALKRVRMNNLKLDPKLKEGDWRDLTASELELLLG